MSSKKEQFLIDFFVPEIQYQSAMYCARGSMSYWDWFGWLLTQSRKCGWFLDFISMLESQKDTCDQKWINPDIFEEKLYLYLSRKE